MTTTALKAIDTYGGIDNYILRLDDKAVSQSNYVTKMRLLISAGLFHKGLLDRQTTRRMGFDKVPPPVPLLGGEEKAEAEAAHLN